MHTMDDMVRAGCATRRAVRFWEEQGLLGEVARANNDNRLYTPAQLNLAKIIAAAQFGGFALDAIKEMLAEYDGDSEVYDALQIRLADQMRAAARLAEALPIPLVMKKAAVEYDL